jgi:hypothetical protein
VEGAIGVFIGILLGELWVVAGIVNDALLWGFGMMRCCGDLE